MTPDLKRIFIASSLVFLILFLQPYYLKWLGIESPETVYENLSDSPSLSSEIVEGVEKEPSFSTKHKYNLELSKSLLKIEQFEIHTDLFSAILTNNGGGSFQSIILKENKFGSPKYIGSYDSFGVYDKFDVVELSAVESLDCSPCLAMYDKSAEAYIKLDMPFVNITNNFSSRTSLTAEESVVLSFYHKNDSGFEITKNITFYGNSYETKHEFIIKNGNNLPNENLELIWAGGLRPTELIESDDVTFSLAIAGQNTETEDINLTREDEVIDRLKLDGNTDWVSIRSKYFTAAIISDVPGKFATLSAYNAQFGSRKITPVYTAGIGYDANTEKIESRLYFGPLDLDYISKTNTTLDKTMNFGFTLIRPIGKGVLWILKFLHNTLRINYGVVLILFAVIVRILTGPLTKKSFQSSQKMQKVQPLVKKLQKQYKKDPQKMNQEVMALYREKGVNPLGGCLPMLLQMPLLWALFVVFRSTIEFRGAGFMLWINDLSQPDIILNLPFHVPLYGAHIAVLPVLMGISIFLTQRMSMATMDPAQKPMMYIMNGFFILLFNQFPSGLNLYYTMYNILNYFQQRSIRHAS